MSVTETVKGKKIYYVEISNHEDNVYVLPTDLVIQLNAGMFLKSVRLLRDYMRQQRTVQNRQRAGAPVG